MPKHARPGLSFATPDELASDVEHLRTTSYDKAGAWDLATIIDHIASAVLSPFDPTSRPVPRPLRWMARVFVKTMARRKKYPPIRLPAPKDLHPRTGLKLEDAYTRFIDAMATLRSLPEPTCDTAVAGPLNTAAFRKLQLLHAAHHLAFLKPRD